MTMLRWWVGAVVMLVLSGSAVAHDPGLSSAHVRTTSEDVEVVLTLSWSEVALLVPVGVKVQPVDTEFKAFNAELNRDQSRLIALQAGTQSRAGARAELDAVQSSLSEAVVVWRWPGANGRPLNFSFPFLARMPFGHRLMVMEGAGGEPVALLDARHDTWTMPASAAPNPEFGVTPSPPPAISAGTAWSFVPLGVEHILAGFDHLCFLAALLLVTTRRRDVVAVVTTFTVAHSLTLAAAAFGAVSLPASIVEPLIAVSIIYVGVENIWLRRAPRYRLALVFGFGLVHGLGFASALADRLPGLSGRSVVPPVLAFNVGVELGQLAVAALLVPVLAWARRREWFGGRAQPACSALIAVAGLTWLVQRL